MAITVEITDGTTTFDLIYDSASQPNYHARKGFNLVSEDTDVLQHRPDNGLPEPIRGNDRDRTVFLTKDVLGSSQDEVLNKIAALKRFIDGADQQALRYWTDGDVNRVDLKIQKENATNYTINPIKWGHVDDSGAHYTAAAQNSGYAIGILVTLHLTAYGEGAAITLRNDLASSPHFLEDSDSDGTCDGWSAVGTPTISVNTAQWLIGGQSQQVITDTSTNEGIQSDVVTASSSSDIVAYVWIRGTGNTVTINLVDGSSVSIATASFNPSNPTGFDKTAVGGGGNIWYRYVVSGTNTNANCRLIVSRTAANASQVTTFRIDGAYLYVGSTTAPDAWCSTSAIQNRYDPTGASAATEARINYVDVWGVPGDSDALVDTAMSITAVSGAKDIVMVGAQSDGKHQATDMLHWVDSADITMLITAGSDSEPSDATRAGGSYKRHTGDGTFAGVTLVVDVGSTVGEFSAFLSVPHRVFLLARSASASTSFSTFSSNYLFTPELSGEITAANTWELVDLGYITKEDFPYTDYAPSASTSFRVSVNPGTNSTTVDIDACLLVPASAGKYILTDLNDNLAVNDVHYILGSKRTTFTNGINLLQSPLGELYTIPSGQKMTRFIYTILESDSGHHLTDTATVTLTVYPRTRHLLGTS